MRKRSSEEMEPDLQEAWLSEWGGVEMQAQCFLFRKQRRSSIVKTHFQSGVLWFYHPNPSSITFFFLILDLHCLLCAMGRLTVLPPKIRVWMRLFTLNKNSEGHMVSTQ